MIATSRAIIASVLALIAMTYGHASANLLPRTDASGGLLIADPSAPLLAYMRESGFELEGEERLEALGLSLVLATPPDRVPESAAVHVLRARFPEAMIARNDSLQLATDARAGRSPAANVQQVMSAIGWQRGGDDIGRGIRIGAIDSALDPQNPALKGAAIVQQQFTSGKPPSTDIAHGTAIAAMLVGRADGSMVTGLLRGATLYHASIFQDGKNGPSANAADFLRGLNWLLKSGVTVINASVTSPSRNMVVVYAMSLLSSHQAVLVAAAGNSGPSGPPVYPAAIPSALAVTAVSASGRAYRYANAGDYIDIAAPGINLPTTSAKITSGTSLAVPFVTAALARLVQVCGISPVEGEAMLETHARDLGAIGWDPRFGWGLLQAAPPCGSGRAPLSAAVPPDLRASRLVH